VVWSCRSNSESCCGYECCSNITGTGISTVDGSTNSTQNTSQAPLSNLSSSPTEANEIAITDCYDIKRQNPVAADGVYAVQPNNTSLPFEVYCDMNTDNGGWTVFQRRIDGLQDFASQNWIDYEDGFGDVQYDHWLGLEKLYWLMEKDAGLPVQMRVDMTDCTGHTLFETYESFLIGDASTKYALLNASGVNGTAGDAFSALPTQIGSKFSTEDDENSNASDTCATALKGGWWYSSCESAHLNSVYYPQCNNSSLNKDGITWSTASKQDGSSYSPTMTKMMIRKSRFPSF
uniref:Fibrinogen C-terminal domain-containing protein n=1 Tax=Plectus sambesii TaxID=2011161 RepID=A0A914XNB1_9BILA